MTRGHPVAHFRGQVNKDRGQILEAKAEAKILAPRPVWPRGLNITGSSNVRARITAASMEICALSDDVARQRGYCDHFVTMWVCMFAR